MTGQKRPKTGGRQKGTPNKATAEIRQLAQPWGEKALLRMAEMAGLYPRRKGQAESEQVRKAALDSVMDRAFGKPSQPMEHSADEGLEALLLRIGRD